MVMKLRIVSPNWTEPSKMAKCVAFRPTRTHDAFFDDMEEAIQVCNGDVDGIVCPIRQECLTFALINNESDGIWGGLMPEQRRYLRRNIKDKTQWLWENALPADELEMNGMLTPDDEDDENEADWSDGGYGGSEEEPDASAW